MTPNSSQHDFPNRVLDPQFNLNKLKKSQMQKFNQKSEWPDKFRLGGGVASMNSNNSTSRYREPKADLADVMHAHASQDVPNSNDLEGQHVDSVANSQPDRLNPHTQPETQLLPLVPTSKV